MRGITRILVAVLLVVSAVPATGVAQAIDHDGGDATRDAVGATVAYGADRVDGVARVDDAARGDIGVDVDTDTVRAPVTTRSTDVDRTPAAADGTLPADDVPCVGTTGPFVPPTEPCPPLGTAAPGEVDGAAGEPSGAGPGADRATVAVDTRSADGSPSPDAAAGAAAWGTGYADVACAGGGWLQAVIDAIHEHIAEQNTEFNNGVLPAMNNISCR